jgi:hypothetical protein
LTLLKERVRNAVLPTPDMVVCSGGGLHVYYLLKECYPLTTETGRQRFKDVLKRLSFAIGGEAPKAHSDASCADVARVLRVAGTWNHKQPENPRRVEVWHETPEPEFTFLEWEAGLPELPTASRARPHSSPMSPTDYDRYRALWDWANKPIPEGERHKRLTSGAAWLLRDLKLPRSIAEELLRRKAEVSAGRNPVPEKELEAILKWA